MYYQGVIWLTEDRCFAYLLRTDAFTSIINRTGSPGEEELIENDEYILWEEWAIEYEPDEK